MINHISLNHSYRIMFYLDIDSKNMLDDNQIQYSLKTIDSDYLINFLKDKLTVSIKQSYDIIKVTVNAFLLGLIVITLVAITC